MKINLDKTELLLLRPHSLNTEVLINDVFIVYPLGSIVIALLRPSVRLSVRPSVFKYLRDRSLVFLKLCMNLGVNKVRKLTMWEF